MSGLRPPPFKQLLYGHPHWGAFVKEKKYEEKN